MLTLNAKNEHFLFLAFFFFITKIETNTRVNLGTLMNRTEIDDDRKLVG